MLEIRGLSKNFGGLMAVAEFDLSVGRNEFLGIIGPNGAGKTTMLNLITGYLAPSGGSILLEGKPIHGLRPYQICHLGVGRTFQVVRPFAEMTVLDNIMTGALFADEKPVSIAEARARSQHPLSVVGLAHKADLPASALTLGEKKKLELARALATRPRLLLLDEVMAGLTRSEIDDLLPVLKRIHASGVTIMMIEHLVHVILELSQRVMVLNFGRKLCEGPPEEVVRNPAVIESYLGKPLEAA
ncbi:MAG TPA: ABC transporter ATP-binding protein [Azospirillum sp.]|nr:ABC transporter ATP-binding protein [Azospirillum sp.]